MPTYRYRCEGCGKEFEVWQSITDDALRTHDEGCGGPLVKVLTPAGIVLKGSGFYKNDSRSAARSGASKDGEKPGSEKSAAPAKDGDGKSGSSSSGGDAKSGSTSGSSPASSPTP